MRLFLTALIAGWAVHPAAALAWGYEGHEIITEIARAYLKPTTLANLNALLASDQDNLTAHDMGSEATWADRYRSTGHPETGSWHFVDTELDHPDLSEACFGFPSQGPKASRGPAQDCIVDKIDAFAKELADPSTPTNERLLALKYVLHFFGDLHQPLHASDHNDKGGNCVLLALGGPRSINLHSYWDTTLVQELGSDASLVAKTLIGSITPAMKASWESGDTRHWALESYGVAKTSVYTIGSRPGCDASQGAIGLPEGYDQKARTVAALQLEKAGVRLAYVLNRALAR